MLLADSLDAFDELDVDLNGVARLLLLVALPALGVAPVALRSGQPVQVGSLQDPPDPGRANRDVVIPLQIHGDLGWTKVVMLPQVDDLAPSVSDLLRRQNNVEGRLLADKTPSAAVLQTCG